MAAVLAWAAGFGIIAATPAFAQQPNIVHIVADDLKWKDVGYHGSDFSTPNIDRLATTGARLDQF
jgi:arylsulfatase A-like enzyme